MATTSVQDVRKWITDQQYLADTGDFGVYKKAVAEATKANDDQWKTVVQKKATVESSVAGASGSDDLPSIKEEFSTLEATVQRRLHCLETLSEIVQLEDTFEPLWKVFVEKSTALVKNLLSKPSPAAVEDWTVNTSQDCIEATRNVWEGVDKMLKCSALHIDHAARYHQFFADVKEYRQWMLKELGRANDLLQVQNSSIENANDIKRLTFEVKTALTLYLRWKEKTTGLWMRSQTILPVPWRLKQPDYELPVTSLANYRTKEISVFEGEELVLLDNSQEHFWKVRNLRGEVNFIPSTFVLIPGPDLEATNAASGLHLHFLLSWTDMIKKTGKSLIRFLLKVIRNWTADEEQMLVSLGAKGKEEVLRLLEMVESLFSPHWDPYPGYDKLRKRITKLRTLFEDGHQDNYGSSGSAERGSLLVVETDPLSDLLNTFKDFWQQWQQFRVATELSRYPEYLLAVQSADQFKFLSPSDIAGRWGQSLLDFGDNDLGDLGDLGDSDDEDGDVMRRGKASNLGRGANGTSGLQNGVEGTEVTEEGEVNEWDAQNGHLAGELVTIETASQRAESSQLTTSEQEERQTFVITSVTDPRSGEQISLDVAVSEGIINQLEGKYVNPSTGETIPIPSAMNAGKIKVELTKTKKSAEKKSDLGLITIKTYKELRPFTVRSAIDAKTEKVMAVEAAIKAGILDLKRGVYKNLNTEEELSLADALDSGLLNVEFDESAEIKISEAESVAKTYAVHAVVDTATSSRLTFSQAIASGLINTDTGAYLNRSTGTTSFIGDAIRQGLVKASVVNDPTLLNADTGSIITLVDTTTQKVRQKIIRPLMAVYALRKAAGSAAATN